MGRGRNRIYGPSSRNFTGRVDALPQKHHNLGTKINPPLPIPNVTFYVRYDRMNQVNHGGRAVSYTAGCQEVSQLEWDGVSESVFSLAFPGLTCVWNATNLVEGTANQIPSSPFLLTAIQQNKAYDSFATNPGLLVFGGIVPVHVLDTVTTVPIQAYAPNSNQITVPSNVPGTQFEWYAIDIDSYTLSGCDDVVTKNNSAILDSGATLDRNVSACLR
ncbi:hypothetical protein B0H11DRAFT_2365763 [Mycena galericulata]|nr:hypothetical protein B0H11DRAFT_2365763 [Mycena galericulata]